MNIYMYIYLLYIIIRNSIPDQTSVSVIEKNIYDNQRLFFIAYLLEISKLFDCIVLQKIGNNLLDLWKNCLPLSLNIHKNENEKNKKFVELVYTRIESSVSTENVLVSEINRQVLIFSVFILESFHFCFVIIYGSFIPYYN
jgi:hypothetical protein